MDRLPSRQEIDAYGEAADRIYESLRANLETQHWGRYVTIHPVTGDYALADTHRDAVQKMQKKYPGVAFCSYHIGYRAMFHFGGRGASDGKRVRRGRHDQGKN